MRPLSSIGLGLAISMLAAMSSPGVGLAERRRAAPGSPTKKVQQLDRQAMEAYDLLDARRAASLLEQALRSKLDPTSDAALIARLHMHLAVVAYVGLTDAERARREALAAVRADPSITIDPMHQTAEIDALFDQARRQGRPAATPGSSAPRLAATGGSPPDCGKVSGLDHERLREVPFGRDVTFSVLVGRELEVGRVSLYLKTKFAPEYMKYTLQGNACRFFATVPSASLVETSFEYYIAVAGNRGEVLASVGTRTSPLLVAVAGAPTAPSAPAWLSDDKLYFTGPRVPVDRARADDTGGIAAFWVGTGGGYAAGPTELAGREVTCCFSPAPMHMLLEVGYRFSERTALTAAGRLELPLRADLPGHPKFALAAQLRVRRALTDRGDGFQLIGSLGWGVLRQSVTLSESVNGGTVDTTAIGPFLVGGGVGYVVGRGKLRLIGELQTILGMPMGFVKVGDAQVSLGVHLDATLGLIAAF